MYCNEDIKDFALELKELCKRHEVNINKASCTFPVDGYGSEFRISIKGFVCEVVTKSDYGTNEDRF